MHNGQLNTNLGHKRKALSGLNGLLEVVSLEVMAEGVRVVQIWRAGGKNSRL